jgi:geranylgeranyl diphosphate synthase type 3
VIELNNAEAVKIFTEQMLELHRGQGMEIHWREEGQCPSEEEYRTMVIQKTGGLFNLAVRMMQLFQTKSDPILAEYNYGELANLMGLYFQIRDDYANLVLDEYTQTKTFAEDLTEGKYNFPIIHAIRNFPGDNKVQNILKQKTHDMELKKYCVSLLESSGSFEYSKLTMTELDERIRRQISQLGGNTPMMYLMDQLGNWKQ